MPDPFALVRVGMYAYYLPYLNGALNDIGATLGRITGKKRDDAPDCEYAVVFDADSLNVIVRHKNRGAWTDFVWMTVLFVAFVVCRAVDAELAAGICAGSGFFVACDLVKRFREIGAQRKLAAVIAEKEGERDH